MTVPGTLVQLEKRWSFSSSLDCFSVKQCFLLNLVSKNKWSGLYVQETNFFSWAFCFNIPHNCPRNRDSNPHVVYDQTSTWCDTQQTSSCARLGKSYALRQISWTHSQALRPNLLSCMFTNVYVSWWGSMEYWLYCWDKQSSKKTLTLHHCSSSLLFFTKC